MPLSSRQVPQPMKKPYADTVETLTYSPNLRLPTTRTATKFSTSIMSSDKEFLKLPLYYADPTKDAFPIEKKEEWKISRSLTTGQMPSLQVMLAMLSEIEPLLSWTTSKELG